MRKVVKLDGMWVRNTFQQPTVPAVGKNWVGVAHPSGGQPPPGGWPTFPSCLAAWTYRCALRLRGVADDDIWFHAVGQTNWEHLRTTSTAEPDPIRSLRMLRARMRAVKEL